MEPIRCKEVVTSVISVCCFSEPAQIRRLGDYSSTHRHDWASTPVSPSTGSRQIERTTFSTVRGRLSRSCLVARKSAHRT